MCPALCGGSGPMSRPCSSDFPGQLRNWLLVLRCVRRTHNFLSLGNRFLFVSTRFQLQDCLSVLKFILDATGLTAALPSTRQGMHPWVSLETSTLRRMSLVQHLSCCRVSPKLSASTDFWCHRTWCGGRAWRHRVRRYIHHCWSRLGHNSFFSLLFLHPLRHRLGTTYQAEILGAASGAEMPDIEQIQKIVPLITCESPFSQHVCELAD